MITKDVLLAFQSTQMDKTKIKKELIELCIQIISEKLKSLDNELLLIQEAANEETKSSAGDKYETGRAMLMLEKEKLVGQKEQLFAQLKPLKTIDPDQSMVLAEHGAVVTAGSIHYFIASGVGEIKLYNESYFVVSAMAPIAQSMLGKKAGDAFELNNRKFVITEIF